MAKRKNVGGYRLECAFGGLAPSCTECVPCDVANQVKKACDELREIAEVLDDDNQILTQVIRIERAACRSGLLRKVKS